MALKRARPAEEAVDVPRPARAVTAAMATVALGRGSAWATWKFGNFDWQIEAWRLYDIVGELRFLAGWIGDSVSQARMYVTRIDETGEETGEIKDPAIGRLAAVPLGTGAQRDDNLRLLGIDLAVAGEAWIVGEGAAIGDPKGWFVVSGGQLRREGGWISVNRPIQFGGGILRLTDGEDLLIRAWRPHPNDILQSDSPTRSAIPPLREIELLTKREFAELESRLTGAGVWFLPEGIDFPRSNGEPEDINGFMASLQAVAALNIKDQSSASALVPIMATVPDQWVEHIDKFKPVTFWSDLSEQILPMKEKAITRLGATFEVPGEILTGLQDSNHWPVDEETEVYTSEGWVTYEGLHPGVKVLALDIETGTSSFQEIDGARVEHVENRTMLSIEGRYHSSLTTPDHRWPVERGGSLEWARTEDFLSNPGYSAQSKSRRSMILGAPSGDVPTEAKLSDDFVRLLAWCATDCDLTPQTRGRQLRIRQRNAENLPSIEAAVSGVEHFRHWDESAGVHEWIFSNASTKAMDEYGQRVGTRWILSDETVRQLTAPQLLLLLETAIAANGYGRQLFAVDERRLDAFEHAAVLLGFRVSRGRRKQQTGWGTDPVAWLAFGVQKRFAPRDDIHIKQVDYTGVIFCPKVPVGQSFLARRHGKIYYTGNTAFAVSEEGIKRIKPYLATIADTLTRGFLVPTLERAGVPDADQYAYAFDVAPLSVRPNRLPEAMELNDRYLLKDLDTVQAGAFGEEQMPTEAEKLRMLLFRSVAKDPSLLTDPGVQAALGIQAITGPAPAALPVAPEPAAPERPVDGPPDNLDEGMPDTGAPGPAASSAVRVAAKALVLRALEMAGTRLTTLQDRKHRWAGVPRHELHFRVGPLSQARADEMLETAWAHLPALCDDLGVRPDDLETVLRTYCGELLTRGIPHADDLLAAAVAGIRRTS